MQQIFKYPRTPHISGSRLQKGDEDLKDIPFTELRGRHLVIEEKIDGANSGISFDHLGKLQLQSRGHYLTGGPRERQFDLFKSWANIHVEKLRTNLGERYVVYGEWCYAKHTIFYNALPHYFLEFDVLDLEKNTFLSTPERQEMHLNSPIVSVPVLYEGEMSNYGELVELVKDSKFIKGQHISELREWAKENGLKEDLVEKETDFKREMEGLYIKVEENGQVIERYKWVRAGFLQAVFASESHWMDRPILANRLADGLDIFKL